MIQRDFQQFGRYFAPVMVIAALLMVANVTAWAGSDDVRVLTQTAPNTDILAGESVKVYGCTAANHITIASGATVELRHMPGNNTITIQADSTIFSVSRSGAMVTFEGTDGTQVKLPATSTVQVIVFEDEERSLVIHDNQIRLGEQVLTLTPEDIKPLSNIAQLYFANGESLSVFPGDTASIQTVVAPVDEPGNFDFQLENAPQGMTINTQGLITWAVPASTAPTTTHSFTVKVVNSDNNASRSLTGRVFVMQGNAVATATVDETGGKLESADGVVVDVPAGAVSQATEVKIVEGRDEENNPVLTIDAPNAPADMEVEITLPDPNTFSQSKQRMLRSSGEPQKKYASKAASYPLTHNYISDSSLTNVRKWYYDPLFGAAMRMPSNVVKMSLRNDDRLIVKESFQLNAMQSEKNLDGEAVLFIHGYATGGGLGGGEGTWKNFPALIAQLEKDGHALVPFEFRWITNARFQDAADDLGECLKIISDSMKTHKKVHIIAHSFGGVLIRTLLQKLNANNVDYRGYVASLTTLGTPHSGIFDSTEARSGISFPDGQDSLAHYFSAQISAYQMGENNGIVEAFEEKLQQMGASEASSIGNYGDFAGDLATTVNLLPKDLPIQVGIGMEMETTFAPDSFTMEFEKGDGLITYEGQRFDPSLSSQQLLEMDNRYRAQITEFLLGLGSMRNLDPDVEYSLGNKVYEHYKKSGFCETGYKHSMVTIFGESGRAEPYVTCTSASSCNHASFIAVKDFLCDTEEEPEELQAPTGVTAMQVNSSILISWNAVQEADCYKVQWKENDGSGLDDEWQTATENLESCIYTTSYTHTCSDSATAYRYRVVAVQGDREAISDEVEIRVLPIDPNPVMGDTITIETSGTTFTFVKIPNGTFLMGSPDDDEFAYGMEKPQHLVTISKDFYMQTTEVTQGQWTAIMGENPSWFDDCGDNCPVEDVFWDDVQDFIKKLNAATGRTFALPTEAQWEYAARAGTTTPFYTGACLSTDQANYDGNDYPLSGCPSGEDRDKTIAVGSFAPNPWGLYDMYGNVWEWCQDWYGDYESSPSVDPTGPDSGSGRVIRGGGFAMSAGSCRSAYRLNHSHSLGHSDLGFRLVLIP